MLRTLLNDKFRCLRCAFEFRAPMLPDQSYGEFILHSKGTIEQLLFDANDNRIFDEFVAMVICNLRITKFDDNTKANIAQNAFGLLAVNPNANDYHWEMNRTPTCPNCGEAENDRWRDYETIDINLSEPSVDDWEGYTAIEKEKIIDQFLKNIPFAL